MKKGGRSGPRATRAAPVSVAKSNNSSGASSSASASASARMSRPSASVLPISTVSPLRLTRTSPGRIESAEIAFSTIGIERAQAHVETRLHDQARQAERGGGAAHVLLHQLHAARRLDVEAARIESDALADQRHLGRVGAPPDEVDEARRLGGGAADRMNERQVARRAALARASLRGWRRILPPDRAASCSSAAGPRSLAGVLTRSRPNATASAMRSSRAASTPSGAIEARPRRPIGAVTLEAIEAEQKRQRRQLRLVRRVGEAVDPLGKRARQRARRHRIAPSCAFLRQAEEDAGEAAFGVGQTLHAPRLRLEAAGRGETRRVRADRRARFLPGLGAGEPDGNGGGGGRGEGSGQGKGFPSVRKATAIIPGAPRRRRVRK